MKFVSISQVRNSQDLSKADIPYVMRYVFVPIAWPFTCIFASLGISPNMMTMFRLVLHVLAAIFIMNGNSDIFFWGLFVYLFSVVLDSVDGNLSRLQNRATFYGKYFDGITDTLGELLFHVALIYHFRIDTLFFEQNSLISLMGCIALGLLSILAIRLPLFVQSLPNDVANGPKAHPKLDLFLSNHLIGKIIIKFDLKIFDYLFDAKYLILLYFSLIGSYVGYISTMNHIYIICVVMFFLTRTLRSFSVLDHYKISRSAKID